MLKFYGYYSMFPRNQLKRSETGCFFLIFYVGPHTFLQLCAPIFLIELNHFCQDNLYFPIGNFNLPILLWMIWTGCPMENFILIHKCSSQCGSELSTLLSNYLPWNNIACGDLFVQKLKNFLISSMFHSSDLNQLSHIVSAYKDVGIVI